MTEQKDNRTKTFFKNFGIYTIGSLGTRLINFLLIPFYTFFVAKPSDYGYYDICLQICMLFLPLATLQMRESAFRFLFESDSDEKRKQIVTFIYKTLIGNLILILAIAVFLSFMVDIKFMWYTCGLLITMSIHEVACQISRGLQRNDIYVTCNLLNALLVSVFSVLLLALFDMGVEGIFIANILSRIIIIIFIEIRLRVFTKFFKFGIDTKQIGKELLKYALPLIPSAMCWLVTTSSDRFFIRAFVSTDMNGIYAVAVRFSMILQTFAFIFYQTWQETALTQYNAKDRDDFFSKIFNSFLYVLVLLLVAYTFFLKMNYSWLIHANYQGGVTLLYLMGVSVLLVSIASYFFELGYQCAKDTKRIVRSILFTAILSVTLNFTLTPHFGIYGVIATNIIAYLFLAVYRFIDTRKYFTISVSKNSYLLVAIIVIGAVMYAHDGGVVYDLCCMIALIACLLCLVPKSLISLLPKLRKRS